MRIPMPEIVNHFREFVLTANIYPVFEPANAK